MPNTWRLAKSLDVLRDQINDLSPHRNKKSDGTKGDDAHAKRKSDHNPLNGVVHGMDITNDPAHGVDGKDLANALIDSKDARIDYVISRKEIAYGAGGKHPWLWQKYTGVNAHDHHTHISVRDEPKLGDSTAKWELPGFNVGAGASNPPTVADEHPIILKGNKGYAVERLQKLLNAHGAKPQLKLDADFGERTDKAVRDFQKAQGISVDGTVGMQTWDLLEKVAS